MAAGAIADAATATALAAGLHAWPSAFLASLHWPAWQAFFLLQLPQANTGGK